MYEGTPISVRFTHLEPCFPTPDQTSRQICLESGFHGVNPKIPVPKIMMYWPIVEGLGPSKVEGIGNPGRYDIDRRCSAILLPRTLPVVNTLGEMLPVEFWTEAIISFMTKSMDCNPGLAHLQAAALKSLATWSDFLRFAVQGQCILSISVVYHLVLYWCWVQG